MYARNGDRKIPAGITIPENYGGSAFVPPPDETAECGAEPARHCGSCREDDAHDGADITSAPDRDAPCCAPDNCGCKANNGKGDCDCPAERRDRPCGIMNINIGAEELLLIGIMALVFFNGEARDNELLICLLLVLLI